MARFKFGKLKINTDYHVPYMAGYNKTGDTLYIDSRVPLKAKFGSHRKEVNVLFFLILHELVEETLEHNLGIKYRRSHLMAIGAEKAAAEVYGFDWKAYDKWCDPYIKLCETVFTKLPPDLDYEPYIDSKDWKIIKKINELIPNAIKEKN